jgi:hypothetical protein
VKLLRVPIPALLASTAFLFATGCATSSSFTTRDPDATQISFAWMSPEQQLEYAQHELPLQRMAFLRIMDSFLVFMNDNQDKWRFRVPEEFAISIAGPEHFLVVGGLAKPNTTLVALGSILAIQQGGNAKVTMTARGFLLLESHSHTWSPMISN